MRNCASSFDWCSTWFTYVGENQSNSIWIMNKMSLMESASPHLHPFNWCERIVSRFVRYRWEFREFHIDTGIIIFLTIHLFIEWFDWIARSRTHIYAREWEREREQQNNNFIYIPLSISWFYCTHISLAAWDSFRCIHIPHEIVFSLQTAANFLIVCWNNDESITCAPTHATKQNVTHSKIFFGYFDSSVFRYGRVAIVFTFLPSAVSASAVLNTNEFFIRIISNNFDILMTRYFFLITMEEKKRENEITMCWLCLIIIFGVS